MRTLTALRHLSVGMAIHVGLEATRFVNSDRTAAFICVMLGCVGIEIGGEVILLAP